MMHYPLVKLGHHEQHRHHTSNSSSPGDKFQLAMNGMTCASCVSHRKSIAQSCRRTWGQR